MNKVKFGSCLTLYGCIGRTADEVYAAIHRLKYRITIVPQGSTSLAYCDIAVVDTVQTLLACRPAITSEMIVIVCDSIIALQSLNSVTPYDYEGDGFTSFKLKEPSKINFSSVTKSVKIEQKHFDVVTDVVQRVLTTGVLSDFMNITSRMNKPARKTLRSMLANLIVGKETIEGVSSFLRTLDIDSEAFISSIHTKYFKNLCNAIRDHYKGHSLSYVRKRYGVKDTYEITFFTKMLRDNL